MARSLCHYPVASGESFRDIMYILENESAEESAREGFLQSKEHGVYYEHVFIM